jgi:charged multivesicular body protein 1
VCALADMVVCVSQALQQNNIDGARIYAENSIRNKTQAMNFLRMASRIEAVASKVDTAIRMNQVSSSMAGVVRSMGEAASIMNLEKVGPRVLVHCTLCC